MVFIMGGDQIPTKEALQAFRDLHQAFPDLPVIVHSDVRGTSYTKCPGTFLRTWVHNKEYEMQFTPEEEKVLKDFVLGIQSKGSNGYGFATHLIDFYRSIRKHFV